MNDAIQIILGSIIGSIGGLYIGFLYMKKVERKEEKKKDERKKRYDEIQKNHANIINRIYNEENNE